MTRLDLSLPFVTLLILGVGLFTLNSAAPSDEFMRQVAFLVAGAVALGALVWAGKSRLLRLSSYIYGASLALLVLTYFLGTEVNGAKSWLYLGPLPGFQPSELAKLALILVLAQALHERPIRRLVDYLRVAALALPPIGLVLIEPDLGSALVLVAITAGVVLVRGVPWRHLVLIVLLVGAAVPTLVLPNLKPHQLERLVSFVDPYRDPQGTGYQVIQSTIAVGSGGLLGKGYKAGTQSQLGFIPYRHTDFIFPVLAEEGGFLASVVLLLLYGLLFWRMLAMAAECPFERDQLLITGVLVLVAFQVLVNIGVTIGVAPVTGITLPLVSYGGTSLVSTLVALGFAWVVYRDRFANW
ncbi:MAG: rod shape-determining protein RodA [Trueperaceae bacterium]|nr:rod shape-determining protein RodA [Trueperaceae bacterium]HRQ10199.1 rod shape-determining protein RodA [Trueperaceae bacterium]